MFFKYEFTVSELGLTPTSEHYRREYPLVFNYGEVRVELRPPTDDEQKTGHGSWTTLGEAIGEFEPSKRVAPMFEMLARNELPEGSSPDENAYYFDKERGKMRENYAVPADIMPPAFQERHCQGLERRGRMGSCHGGGCPGRHLDRRVDDRDRRPHVPQPRTRSFCCGRRTAGTRRRRTCIPWCPRNAFIVVATPAFGPALICSRCCRLAYSC
jgi:hypothetical protein